MNNLDTVIKRMLINALFGSGILLVLALAVLFRYYIDKQTPQIKQRTEQITNTK